MIAAQPGPGDEAAAQASTAGDPLQAVTGTGPLPAIARDTRELSTEVGTDTVQETYDLHPQAVRLWSIGHAIAILIVLVPATIAASVLLGAWSFAAGVIAVAVAWRISMRYRRAAHTRFRCERFARGLRYRHGVWWQSEIFIPTARVQHTEVNQGPIQRRYGIGALKVYTAAVQLGSIEIGGLAYTDAVLLRDRLLGRAPEPHIVADNGPDDATPADIGPALQATEARMAVADSKSTTLAGSTDRSADHV